MPAYRSKTSTAGRNMAGARSLWRATGMKDDDFQKPIIAIANSFTQFVPGHVHLKDLGQLVAREIEAAGGVAKEFNTIAVDDGIAMGHDGMLYSLPSRDIIADSVEYMVNAHCADAIVCISNCDKITPGMLMAAMRLNIPVIFVSGGPMEAGKVRLANPQTQVVEFKKLDLIDAMVRMMNSEQGFTGPVNIGNPGEFTMLELAQLVLKLSGSQSKIIHQPLPSDDPKQRQPNIDLAKAKLGWTPKISLEDGLKETIAYFRMLLK